MGTNFYAHPAPEAEIHLGKHSAGWPFLFRAPDRWPDKDAFVGWVATACSYPIQDEYGHEISFNELLESIMNSYNAYVGKRQPGAFLCGGFQFMREDFC